MTMTPLSRRHLMVSSSIMETGFGDATTLLQPLPASSTTFQPSLSLFSMATSSVMKEPMGFVGFWKDGSSPFTSTCVTTVAMFFFIPSMAIWLSRAICSWYPIAPWVSATQESSGTVCSCVDAISALRRIYPTCGPFPWAMTTLFPACTSFAICFAVLSAASY